MIEPEFDENELYDIDNMSLKDKKGKLGWRKRALEWKIENKYDIEIQNGMTCVHDNEVNNIAECNLLHNILSPSKRTEI